MEYYIIVYKNTFDAMSSEKVFINNNFTFKIMPTPTSITQSCGICTRFADENEVKRVMDEKLVEFKNIYKKTEKGYEILK